MVSPADEGCNFDQLMPRLRMRLCSEIWQDNRTKIRSELTFTLTHTMPL
jgi:hypothetical protein